MSPLNHDADGESPADLTTFSWYPPGTNMMSQTNWQTPTLQQINTAAAAPELPATYHPSSYNEYLIEDSSW